MIHLLFLKLRMDFLDLILHQFLQVILSVFHILLEMMQILISIDRRVRKEAKNG